MQSDELASLLVHLVHQTEIRRIPVASRLIWPLFPLLDNKPQHSEKEQRGEERRRGREVGLAGQIMSRRVCTTLLESHALFLVKEPL